MAQQHTPEEIDISSLFRGLQKAYHRLLVRIYRTICFLCRQWYWLAGVIVIGLIIGYLSAPKVQTKKATLIVQLNFNSANYVYNAIEQLKHKIYSGDTVFLKQTGIIADKQLLVSAIKISPIVDFSDIAPKDENLTAVRYLQTIFDKSQFKNNLLTSDILTPKYKKHKISISSYSSNTKKAVNALLNYLNANPLISEIKAVSVQSAELQIKENQQSIAAIDSIVTSYNATAPNQSKSSSVYVNLNKLHSDNLYQLFKQKNTLLEENKDLKIELLKYDHIVKLINRPELHTASHGLFGQRVFTYPFIGLISLLIVFFLRHLFFKAKRLEQT